LDDVEGALHATTALAMIEVALFQSEHGTRGPLVEIGIHHGKSFLCLAAGAAAGEALVAIDVFDQQELNLDRSGHGDVEKFRSHLNRFFPEARVRIVTSSSLAITGGDRALDLHDVRLFSIDGGHTSAVTRNDLEIADRSLAKRGICFLDDVLNPHWTGVLTGLTEFLARSGSLVPAVFVPNKLVLCRPGATELVKSLFRERLAFAREKTDLEFLAHPIDVYGQAKIVRALTANETLPLAETSFAGVDPFEVAPGDETAAGEGNRARITEVLSLVPLFVSHAQNLEDVILHRVLREVSSGFYVDVGAQDPDLDSVTQAFYETGWRGVNLEPEVRSFARLAAARPRDVNLCAAAGERPGRRRFFDVPNTGLSTLDVATADAHRARGFSILERDVEVVTLADVCAAHAPPDIHFLKIDVEGAERDVLAGCDFGRFRPWVVVVEATRPLEPKAAHLEWDGLLTGAGYSFRYFDGLNRFYLAAEKSDLSERLGAPPNTFDRWVPASTVRAEARTAALEGEVTYIRGSFSWRLTEPLRRVRAAAGRLRKRIRTRIRV
jgi:FkbM family methyltransferase